jgi:thymidylate synthase ThyX
MAEEFKRRIYMLNPRQLSPETIAVTFAKTSRSPLSFREIAAELSAEESSRFHEKWVVGYGHASVAEHAVLHVAFENISRLAIECVESNRLASYTEKSTRYQTWDLSAYYTPPELNETKWLDTYRKACDLLFRTYQDSLEPVRECIRKRYPPDEGEDEATWDARNRSRYVDVCRFLLPSAALANVGMTANARTMAHAIRKMLSHSLQEVRQIGDDLKHAAEQEVPTLLKYVESVPYLRDTQRDLESCAEDLETAPIGEAVRLHSYDPEAETHVLAAALFASASCSYETALSHVRGHDEREKQDLAQQLLGRLERYDVPMRALEHADYLFEAVLDQGAYFELKRHRIMTQTPQRLTTDLGYAVPSLIVEAGFEDQYRNAMQTAAVAYQELASWNPHVAAYVIPNAFNRRVLMSLNLRECYHLCELRSQPNAHFSIRRIALRMAELVREVHPSLAGFMRLPGSADWREIEQEHFAQV